jgi:hypothetical protein
MNIKLDINATDYAVLTKGSTYAYRLTVNTATTSTEAKKTHNKEHLYYPNLERVGIKLLWLGLQGNDINTVNASIALNTASLSKQLEKISALSLSSYDIKGVQQ